MSNKPRKITFSLHLRYAFDNTMSAGPIALIGWLTLVSIVIIITAASIITLIGVAPEGAEPAGFMESLWISAMRAMDAGAVAGDTGTGFRAVMMVVTIGGIFVVSTLIGVLSSSIEAKLDSLRKGRSFVIEKQHTLILGWSPKIFYIISELILANKNQEKPRIVIMSGKDKVEMEDEIKARFPDRHNTKIICRSASPIDLNDLHIVNPNEAKSIIILAPEQNDPDSQVIKTILALTNHPQRKRGKYHIVAEIQNQTNIDVVKMVGKDEVEVVLSGDVISSIMVQTCRQSGLSSVFTELLNFAGAEIYFCEEKTLIDNSFRVVLKSFEDSTIIGIRKKSGKVLLNPPMTTVLHEGDKIIAISEDDDSIKVSQQADPPIQNELICDSSSEIEKPEHVLILGWNNRGNMMVTKLDKYVKPDSQVTIVAKYSEKSYHIDTLRQELKNLRIHYHKGNITDQHTLQALNLPQYNHIFILCYADDLPQQEADSATLIALLHIRNIADKAGTKFSVATEMLDVNNRELAKITQADDFIVSENFISLMLTQISENKELNTIFSSLFSSEGSEISLKPASDYIVMGKPLNFYTIIESAARKSEVAIGYKKAELANNAEQNYGIRVNPKKSDLITLEANDKIIVLAEY